MLDKPRAYGVHAGRDGRGFNGKEDIAENDPKDGDPIEVENDGGGGDVGAVLILR